MKKIAAFLALWIIIITDALFGQTGNFNNIIFLHHSVGEGLIENGHLRELFADYNLEHGTNFQFWDHHYNAIGLRDPMGNYGYGNYDIPNDNTNPDGYLEIFMQPLDSPPDNAFSLIMLPHLLGPDTVTHQIIIFKSCFPASDINSNQMLDDYVSWYLGMRTYMDMHLDKIFIACTPPPLVRSATTPENAARARFFAQWLSSDDFFAGHPNVFVFDLWGILADHDSMSDNYNCLRIDYRDDPNDSHPNAYADSIIAPIFVAEIVAASETYGGSGFVPGDVNGSGIVNAMDIVYFVNYLKGGADIPDPILRADANGNCLINGLDVVYLVNFLKGGSYPIRGDCPQ